MKLGLFGGTFDPIHMGHVIVASEVTEQVGLDRTLFVPAGDPWLKTNHPVSAVEHRMEMVRLAIMEDRRFELSEIEAKRPGATYTVDTVQKIQGQHRDCDQLFLILGTDALKTIDRWHEPKRLLQQVRLVVVSRPEAGRWSRSALEAVYPPAASEAIVVDGPSIRISSTDIRYRVASGLPIRYLVPAQVEQYIRKHRLYRKSS